jgi:hypothetical protein
MTCLKPILQKNGNGVVVRVWEIDDSKPSVYREGDQYKFNSELVKTYMFWSVEQFLTKLD